MLFILFVIGVVWGHNVTSVYEGVIEPNAHAQILINTISMLTKEFNAGTLTFNAIFHLKSDDPFNLIYFIDANDSQYRCFTYFDTSQGAAHCLTSILKKNQNKCQQSLQNELSKSLTHVNTDPVEKNLLCELKGNVKLNISLSPELNQIRTGSPLIIIDNKSQTKSITYSIVFSTKVDPEIYYQHLTIILILVFIFLTALLTTVMCVLNVQYKKVKDKHQMLQPSAFADWKNKTK